MFLKLSQNLPEKTCARASFEIRLQAWGLQLYIKGDSDTGIFLWILWNIFTEVVCHHHHYQTQCSLIVSILLTSLSFLFLKGIAYNVDPGHTTQDSRNRYPRPKYPQPRNQDLGPRNENPRTQDPGLTYL